jgi:glycosyltransferase involved in cell wall biosynthesis
MTADLISVVIPAYNAEATLDETLLSVRRQTYAALEVIVVDDGSRDATAQIVRRHAASDPRVILLAQANAGVAAARNHGWRRAKGDLIAFVDADDLWAPDKLEKQAAVLAAAPPEVGLVYCWSAVIDAGGYIVRDAQRPVHEGEVLSQLLQGNFIGNGSAALVRRAALEAAGGFDTALLEAGAQGCEDIMFYCRVAERFRFAVVREPLVGYRSLPQSMSSDAEQMLRSWILMSAAFERRAPDRKAAIHRGLLNYGEVLLSQALGRRRPWQALRLLGILGQARPTTAAWALHGATSSWLHARLDPRRRPSPMTGAGGSLIGKRFTLLSSASQA